MTEDERIESIIAAYRRRNENYRRLGEDVERMLKDLLRAAVIPVSSVTNRLKDVDSLRRKLQSSNKYQTLTDITDIVGARVITYFSDDVDPVANIIRRLDNFAVDLTNSVDKRRELRPDQFGYQSLHLVATLSKQRIFNENRNLEGLKIEIQVRSLLQHAWAEIEHAYYKSERNLPSTIARRVSLVAGLLEVGDNEFVAIRRDASDIVQSLPVCRGEGLTELIPDFWIDFPRQTVDAESTVVLSVNTNITNRLVAPGPTTEVEMHIEGKAPYGSPARGTMAGVNALKFGPIKQPTLPKGDLVRARISGLRVCAFQLGVSSSLVPTTIQAMLSVRVNDKESSEQAGAPLAIASVLPSLRFGVISGDNAGSLPLTLARSEPHKEIALTASFHPLFPGAFKTAIGERSGSEMSNIQSTRLALCLNGVPEGAQVFVTVQELPDEAEGPVCFQLTKMDANGVSSFVPVEGRQARMVAKQEVQVFEIERSSPGHPPLTQATHMAAWDCVSSPPPNKLPTFGVIVALPSQANSTTVTALGMYAPVSVVPVASFDSPIPRFGPHGVPVSLAYLV
jgi:ppGpp synthetase/RelA/SpoT-type nucleotidyltranferase